MNDWIHPQGRLAAHRRGDESSRQEDRARRRELILEELDGTLDDRTRTILDRRAKRLATERGWLVRRLLAVADASALTIAFLISELVFRGTRSTGGRYGFGAELTLFALTLPGWIVAAKLYGLYSRDRERADHSTADDAPALLNMVTVGAWLFYGLARFSHLADTSFPKLFAFWAAALVLLVLARVIARHVSRRSLAYVQNTVVV
ncbi:MAG: hypothetical protein ACXVZO_02850, partial [Gaiellaceae bacterium]